MSDIINQRITKLDFFDESSVGVKLFLDNGKILTVSSTPICCNKITIFPPEDLKSIIGKKFTALIIGDREESYIGFGDYLEKLEFRIVVSSPDQIFVGRFESRHSSYYPIELIFELF